LSESFLNCACLFREGKTEIGYIRGIVCDYIVFSGSILQREQ